MPMAILPGLGQSPHSYHPVLTGLYPVTGLYVVVLMCDSGYTGIVGNFGGIKTLMKFN